MHFANYLFRWSKTCPAGYRDSLPYPPVNGNKKQTAHVKLLAFGDHHEFSKKDLFEIKEAFNHLEIVINS